MQHDDFMYRLALIGNLECFLLSGISQKEQVARFRLLYLLQQMSLSMHPCFLAISLVHLRRMPVFAELALCCEPTFTTCTRLCGEPIRKSISGVGALEAGGEARMVRVSQGGRCLHKRDLS